MSHDPFHSLREFQLASGKTGKYYSLAVLEAAGLGKISRLPISIRIVLESLLRNCDGKRVSEANVKELAAWKPGAERTEEIPFVVARIVLQDLAGFPALADFAAMRGAEISAVPPAPPTVPPRMSISEPGASVKARSDLTITAPPGLTPSSPRAEITDSAPSWTESLAKSSMTPLCSRTESAWTRPF